MMCAANDEHLADDLVLGVWAAIVLLGAVRECDDAADLAGIVSKAEQILSGVIPHAWPRLVCPLRSRPRSTNRLFRWSKRRVAPDIQRHAVAPPRLLLPWLLAQKPALLGRFNSDSCDIIELSSLECSLTVARGAAGLWIEQDFHAAHQLRSELDTQPLPLIIGTAAHKAAAHRAGSRTAAGGAAGRNLVLP